MKVAYVAGYWCTNIGNAFFNLGADYVLKRIFGANNVNAVFDHPAGIIRSQKHQGNPKRSLSIIEHTEIDIIVLLGPVLSRDFLKIWSEALITLSKKGTKYMILSCGFMKYSDKDVQEIKSFFEQYPPLLVTTRDREAFNLLNDCNFKIYDGIDFAFFLPEAHSPCSFDYQSILALNFDKIFEPRIRVSNELPEKYDFVFDNKYWCMSFNKLITSIGRKTDRFSDALVYALSVFPAKDRSMVLDDYNIIRTDHRFTPFFKNKVFRYSNSFVSDIPNTYLDIYANSRLTLSDRVHACVATLAYGHHAMLFSRTKRSKLLDRVGALSIYTEPTQIDVKKLAEEKNSLIDWISNSLNLNENAAGMSLKKRT